MDIVTICRQFDVNENHTTPAARGFSFKVLRKMTRFYKLVSSAFQIVSGLAQMANNYDPILYFVNP